MDKLEVVARAHVTLNDDGLYADLEVLNGEDMQADHSPVDLTLHAPAQAEIDRLRERVAELERDHSELSDGVVAVISIERAQAIRETARALAAEAEIDRLRGEVERLRIHLKRSGANLAAAISLLRAAFNQKKPPNMVVSSDKMFGEMLSGYETVLDVVRATLKDTPMTDLTEIKRPTKDTYD